MLRERYFLIVGPLLIMLAIGLRISSALLWVAGPLLALLKRTNFDGSEEQLERVSEFASLSRLAEGSTMSDKILF